jgi:hypothetical protein
MHRRALCLESNITVSKWHSATRSQRSLHTEEFEAYRVEGMTCWSESQEPLYLCAWCMYVNNTLLNRQAALNIPSLSSACNYVLLLKLLVQLALSLCRSLVVFGILLEVAPS